MNVLDHLCARPARSEDLATLIPALGRRGYFLDRLRDQDESRGVLLVAWVGGAPLGRIYVRLEPPEEPEIRERLPGVALLNHLEVHVSWRNRGIGSALVVAAEWLLHWRGRNLVALGVVTTNRCAPRLYRLYERLGFARWPYGDVLARYERIGDNGERLRGLEWCRIFTKNLAPRG